MTLLNGTMITVAHEETNHEFNISDATFPNSYWPVASWTLGGAVSCLVVLPIMEDFGMRLTFLGTYFVYLVFLVPQALATNFATLVITRFFGGACVSILANTSAGVIGNVWVGERGRTVPTSLYITCYLTGSSAGPVIGAAILDHLPSWRWISWLQLIWAAALFPLYIIFFPETRGAAILAARARKNKLAGSEDAAQITLPRTDASYILRKLRRSITRPIYMLFTEPVLFTFVLWSSFMVGTIYLFTQSVEQVFLGLYNYNPIQAGYMQSAVVVGELLGWFGSLLSARIYFASAKRNTETPGEPIPEARLYLSVGASILFVSGGMFVYGWTSQPQLPWIAPAVGLAMVGAGSQIVVLAIADYILDSYAAYAGSAISAAVMGENVFAAFLPLAASSMYTTLGFSWASSLLGFLALGISIASFGLVVWGRHLRERSPFMRVGTGVKVAAETPEAVI